MCNYNGVLVTRTDLVVAILLFYITRNASLSKNNHYTKFTAVY